MGEATLFIHIRTRMHDAEHVMLHDGRATVKGSHGRVLEMPGQFELIMIIEMALCKREGVRYDKSHARLHLVAKGSRVVVVLLLLFILFGVRRMFVQGRGLKIFTSR